MAEKALAQAAEPGNDETSHVYVIGPDGGPFKIGVANDVEIRLRQIQIDQSRPLVIKHREVVPFSARYVVEKHAHAILARHRVRGEWFRVPALMAIDAVMQAANDVQVGTLPRAPSMIDRQGRGARPKVSRDGLGSLIQRGSLTPAQARAGQLYRRLFDTALEISSGKPDPRASHPGEALTARNLVARLDAAIRSEVSQRAATLTIEVIGKGRCFSDVTGTSVQRERQKRELFAALDVVGTLLTPDGHVE